MSFILDALKKSENERQRRTGPSLADVRSGAPERRRPPWLIPLAALLAVNLIAILAIVLWPEQQAQEQSKVAAQTPTKAPRAVPRPTPPAVERVEPPPAPPPKPATESRPAVRSLAAESTPQTSGAEAPQPARAQTASPPVSAAAPPPPSRPPRSQGSVVEENVPTMNELIVNGSITLPEVLHVDIHVYSAQPKDRFVFVNNKKYKEGEFLREGPRVEEISTLGVILSHQGQRFLLPRD